MTLLQVRGLVKRFGGLVATDALDLDIPAGEIHAIIGPNGAGKTTLINQLSGALRPDSGTIRLSGVDITRESAHERVGRGIARSFQVTNLFRTLSAVDNVALAVQAGDGSSFRFWHPVSTERLLVQHALELLTRVWL
jgi:branched-chain amino acid transport system ATP-binding protein